MLGRSTERENLKGVGGMAAWGKVLKNGVEKGDREARENQKERRIADDGGKGARGNGEGVGGNSDYGRW